MTITLITNNNRKTILKNILYIQYLIQLYQKNNEN